MEHNEATLTNAVERYMLDELTSSEKEAFEEHFFVCPICAEAVRAGDIFLENARSVFGEQLRRPFTPAVAPEKPKWWTAWLRPAFMTPAAVAAGFALVTIYLAGVRMPTLERQLAEARAPQSIAAFPLRVVRSQVERIVVPPGAASFALSFERPDGTAFSKFVCDIETGSGLTKKSAIPLAGTPGDPFFTVLLSVTDFPPGSYVLVVRGVPAEGAGRELARYAFRVETSK